VSSFSAGRVGAVIGKHEIPVFGLDLGEHLDSDVVMRSLDRAAELLLDVIVGGDVLLSLALKKKTVILYPSISDTLYNKSHLI
jgi:hypothetical protein